MRDPPILVLCSRQRALPAQGRHRSEAEDVVSSAHTTAGAGRRGGATVGGIQAPTMSSSTKDAVWHPLKISGSAALPIPPGWRCRYMSRARMEERNEKWEKVKPYGTNGFTADIELRFYS